MTQRQNEHQPEQDQVWTPCTARELMNLSESLQARKSRRQFLTGSLIAGALAVATAGAYSLLTSDESSEGGQGNDFHYASISCDEVMQAAQVLKKDPSLLDKEKRERIRQHVACCPQCRPKYEKMQLLDLLG